MYILNRHYVSIDIAHFSRLTSGTFEFLCEFGFFLQMLAIKKIFSFSSAMHDETKMEIYELNENIWCVRGIEWKEKCSDRKISNYNLILDDLTQKFQVKVYLPKKCSMANPHNCRCRRRIRDNRLLYFAPKTIGELAWISSPHTDSHLTWLFHLMIWFITELDGIRVNNQFELNNI